MIEIERGGYYLITKWLWNFQAVKQLKYSAASESNQKFSYNWNKVTTSSNAQQKKRYDMGMLESLIVKPAHVNGCWDSGACRLLKIKCSTGKNWKGTAYKNKEMSSQIHTRTHRRAREMVSIMFASLVVFNSWNLN